MKGDFQCNWEVYHYFSRVVFGMSWVVKSLIHLGGTLELATEKEKSLGHILADRSIMLLEPEYMNECSWVPLRLLLSRQRNLEIKPVLPTSLIFASPYSALLVRQWFWTNGHKRWVAVIYLPNYIKTHKQYNELQHVQICHYRQGKKPSVQEEKLLLLTEQLVSVCI